MGSQWWQTPLPLQPALTEGFLPGAESLPSARLCGQGHQQLLMPWKPNRSRWGGLQSPEVPEEIREVTALPTAPLSNDSSWQEVVVKGSPCPRSTWGEEKQRSQSWSHRPQFQHQWVVEVIPDRGWKAAGDAWASPADLWVKEPSAQHHRSAGPHLEKNPT